MSKNNGKGITRLFAVLCMGLILTSCNINPTTEKNGLSQADVYPSQQGENAEPESNPHPTSEDLAFFDQVLLFLQEGLRDHQVMETYTVYFPALETQTDGAMSLVLQGGKGYFLENLRYRHDVKTNWYTFSGSYEPVLTGAFSDELQPDKEMQSLLDGTIFQTEISTDTPLNSAIRFTAPQGPVLHTSTSSYFGDESDPDIHLYLYQDDRLDFTAEIRYPQFFSSGSEAEIAQTKRINQIIKDSFFYGYGPDENNPFHPEQEMYGSIERNYQITRLDDNYLSMRIYEFNSFRGANHPNEWETGLTINMETGEKVALRDIAENKTPSELLDSGAFHCLQIWRNEVEQNANEIDQYQIDVIRTSWEKSATTPDDLSNYFYLTEDSLGLISRISRYNVCMEAKYSDLGLNI